MTTEQKKAPSVYVCMPTYDTMQTATCISLIQLFDKMTAAKVKTNFATYKCPYVGYGRNVLTSMFLASDFEYQLFVDADVSFQPQAVGRMLLAQKDMICAPYRKKTQDNEVRFSVAFKDNTDIHVDEKGLVKISKGPAGLTLIHRKVYDKIIKDNPKLKINFYAGLPEEHGKYLYNLWENAFLPEKGIWYGEDVAFCNLAEKSGFDFYALADEETTHYGNFQWKGKLVDTFKKALNGKDK
jgi:hypothetical protein|tara:strand:- start:252 stop:971 length:720 start_codon:yes stop_codon:yes gene_type:complete